ncbi:acetyltransferase, GNAT family protein [Pseudooceanicola batsensis HTCC2597]|uniref:Acetyltransferase, GNAT family protein n=1 Tax=Pseudooceanicola batsensis (strain ATCC BAA-863 / DSM 15984 / KCTC 12145 / HTCC2597) TaxID=252305 RepID=A3TY71_PSEBH|nr:GNAT family N-acetyltransferase [Pseudooceanicola batsensis]EAQ03105.1 acetyltransferase, GNAT family protein [Pseudooceanicola batsensis HTCC2597]
MSGKFPEITTERLYMHVGRIEDLDELDAYFTTEESRYVGGPRSRSATFDALCAGVGHWYLRGFGMWILNSRDDGTQVGIAGFSQPDGWPEPELTWVVYDQFSGQGIATEAVAACRRAAARHLGIKTPISLLRPEHLPLIKMVERMGASRVADMDLPEIGPIPAWRFPEPETNGNA